MWINPKILEQIKKNCAQLLQSLLILTKIEEFDFKEQYQTFNNYGYAVAPDGSGNAVGNKWLREKMGGKTIFDTRQSEHAKELKRKREATGDGNFVFNFQT